MNEFSNRPGLGHVERIGKRLADALREAQIAAADKGDVVVDMKEADRARLELLAQDLQPVFDDVPLDDQQWDFVLSSGLQPRLWIDCTSHVMMGRDRRTYRFVRDTRLGRVVMAESTDIRPISDAVTAYIADRIIERQRMMEGEAISLRGHRHEKPEVEEVARADALATPLSEQAAALAKGSAVPSSRAAGFVAGLVWFLLGALLACGVLLFLFRAGFTDFSALI